MAALPPNTVLADYGETITLELHYQDIDLSEATVRIAEIGGKPQVQPPALAGAVVTVPDPAAGHARLSVSREIAAQLYRGRTNFLRLEALFEDGSSDVTPQIWITVR
jgi:hypothetical protein